MSVQATPLWLPAPDDAEVAGSLATAFAARYGHHPDGVWAAPGRVNLIGEHTDYNQGLCLPIALPHRTYAAVRLRPDGLVRVASLQQDGSWEDTLDHVGPGRPDGWAAYALGVLWVLQRRGIEVPGADVLIDGRVPLGSGLSSSAALECAVAGAWADLVPAVAELTPAELAAACVTAENVVAGASTGGLDQTIALRAVAGHAMLLDCRDFTVEQVPWRVGDHGWRVLVVDTRAPHALVDGQYAERRRSCEEAAAALGVASLRDVAPGDLPAALERLAPDDVMVRRTRHVVTEIERVRQAATALRADDVLRLGALMTASHASLRDDYEVSCAELDAVVETSLAAGAVGARMTGGGFGGSAIALVRHEEAPAIATAVTEVFAGRGWPAPQVLEAVPRGPAARVR
ncbi:MAG TPA: galactokinase [Pedococcus sp.]|jgi:galactokinase